MQAPFLNLSAYAFVPLDRLPERRDALHRQALACGVKGTVLLAEEGINLFVAGAEAGLREWLEQLRSEPRLASLVAKESRSDTLPFRFLRVKVKREIIRMGQPQFQPAAGRAPTVDAVTLKRWIDNGHDDAGRELVLLDTRNGFEVDAGGFDGALNWRLKQFSDFPRALAECSSELEGRTVVSYCTGGIRCEKAALAMRAAGLDNVWQLDGGVLRYLELLRGAPHWHGNCFVFDGRETVSPNLRPEPLPARSNG